MKRLIAFLSLFFIFGIASAECVIYGHRSIEDENGQPIRMEEYVRARYKGSCSVGDNEVQKPKPKPTKAEIDYVVNSIRFKKRNNLDTKFDEDELVELLSR